MAEQLLCGEAGRVVKQKGGAGAWLGPRSEVPLKMVSADSVGEFERGGWEDEVAPAHAGNREGSGLGTSWVWGRPGRVER